MTHIELLKSLGACPEAVKWATEYPDAQSAWDACETNDWAFWLISRLIEADPWPTSVVPWSSAGELVTAYVAFFVQRGWSIWLGSLTSLPAGMTWPSHVGGSIFLHRLTSFPAGMTWPSHVGGDIWLGSLTSLPSETTWPSHVGGSIYLDRLTSFPAGTTWPSHVGGTIFLHRLTSFPAGMTWPSHVGGSIYHHERWLRMRAGVLETIDGVAP